NGALLHLGRRDRQLEVRGLRVEPSEVEAVLREHPAIGAAVVGGHRDDDGTQRVVAWVVARERRVDLASELARLGRERLPAAVLHAHGVSREAVVALALARTRSFAIAMLAVLRAGGACLPLDPRGPRQRTAAMLRSSGARWLLARAGEQIESDANVIRLDP